MRERKRAREREREREVPERVGWQTEGRVIYSDSRGSKKTASLEASIHASAREN